MVLLIVIIRSENCRVQNKLFLAGTNWQPKFFFSCQMEVWSPKSVGKREMEHTCSPFMKKYEYEYKDIHVEVILIFKFHIFTYHYSKHTFVWSVHPDKAMNRSTEMLLRLC